MLKKLSASAALLLLALRPCFATTANSFVTPQTPTRGLAQFVQGTDSAGTPKTLYTSAAQSRCYMVWASNNDSVGHPVVLSITNSAKLYVGITANIPTTAGYAVGVPSVSLMWSSLPTDQYGNAYIQMVTGDVLQAYFATSFSSGGAVINVVATCSDF